MTVGEAKKIKKWYTKGTYRYVATRAAEKWPAKRLCAGNQCEGMELVSEATQILNSENRR